MVAAEMVSFGQAMSWMGFRGSWGNWPPSGIFLAASSAQRWRVPRLLSIPVRCCHSWHFVPLSLNTTRKERQLRVCSEKRSSPGAAPDVARLHPSHDTQTATDLATTGECDFPNW